MKKALVAYIPVLHEGYRLLFEKYSDADLYVFGPKIIEEFDYLSKEIRALNPSYVKKAVENWDIFENVFVLNNSEEIESEELIFPNEDVSRMFAKKYFGDRKVIFEPIFLRWDRSNTKKEKVVGAEKVITENEFMNQAFSSAEKSPDWWRKVGAVLVKDGKILFSRYNNHLPSDHSPYAEGDPRNASHKGKDLDLYTSIHCEAGIIADAAKQGISIEGADMFVTDFPCPVCAKQIATAGIKKLYFTKGYAVLDGERVLKNSGVEIIKIKESHQ